MKISKKFIIVIILTTIYSVLFFGMLINTLLIKNRHNTNDISAKKITNVSVSINDKNRNYNLPYKFTKLNPRQTVKIKFKVNTHKYNYLYVKSVYAPFKVYANNKLIYKYSARTNSPSFMKDPATKIDILQIPNSNKHSIIEIEYRAPIDRNSLIVHPFIKGEYKSIRNILIKEMFFTVLVASATLILGIALIFIGFICIPFEKKAVSFLWIGLFSILTGLFSLGECNLTQLYVGNESLLYILDFCCFFTLPVPIIEFGKSLIDFKNKKTLVIAQFIQGICAVTALFLQVFSIVPLYKTLYLFIILSPCLLIFFAISIIKEHFSGNKQANGFMFPIIVIAISAIIEAINYKYRFVATLSSCFMIGVLIFTVLITIRCATYIKELIALKEHTQKLEYDVYLLEKQIQVQRQKNEIVLQNAEIIKNQRHDLRHQLAVIGHYNKEGKTQEITEYINTLIDAIPSERSMTYCENQAVNAIIIYYLNLISANNIKTNIKLSIPDNLQKIQNNDLCIIIGNLLENAIEACNRLEDGTHKFIKLSSRLQYDTLTITLDNSFNGQYTKAEDIFISSKRNEPGIGINSIRNVTKKYNGGCKFETKDNVFMASVYLKLV